MLRDDCRAADYLISARLDSEECVACAIIIPTCNIDGCIRRVEVHCPFVYLEYTGKCLYMLRRVASSTLMVLQRVTTTTYSSQSRTSTAAAAISRGPTVASFRPAVVPTIRSNPALATAAWGAIKFPVSHTSPGSRGLVRTVVVQAKKSGKGGGTMPRGVKKENLPTKVGFLPLGDNYS